MGCRMATGSLRYRLWSFSDPEQHGDDDGWTRRAQRGRKWDECLGSLRRMVTWFRVGLADLRLGRRPRRRLLSGRRNGLRSDGSRYQQRSSVQIASKCGTQHLVGGRPAISAPCARCCRQTWLATSRRKARGSRSTISHDAPLNTASGKFRVSARFSEVSNSVEFRAF